MLEWLWLRPENKLSERKARLCASACCRRVYNLLTDKHCRKALAVAERFADAEVTAEKLRYAWGDARRAAQAAHREDRETAESSAMWAVSLACEADIGRVMTAVGLAARCEAFPGDEPRLARAQREQTLLVQDIFGNPFCPLAVEASWLTWRDSTILHLAQVAYEERETNGHLNSVTLAVLADALDEAGADAALAAHLRHLDAVHVRGCHAIDVLLGKA
jgi:hypothetical protein